MSADGPPPAPRFAVDVRLPLDVATEPHVGADGAPDGLRIAAAATLDGVTHVGDFALYPPPGASLTAAAALAKAAALREAVQAANRAADLAGAAEDGSARADLAARIRRADRLAEAAGAVLRDALGPAPLTPEEAQAVALFGAFMRGAAHAYLTQPPAPQEKKPKRPQGPAAVGTYPELALIGQAAADGPTLANWREAPGGGALVHTRKKAGLQVRFAPSLGGDRWADPLPGAVSADLFTILSANGGLDSVFLAQVVADLAIGHEHENVSLDDLGRLIGRDPRSTKDREAMRRDLWERLKFLDGITIHGARRGTYRDPSTRRQIPIESRDALFLISGAMWPEQGTLDGSAVPLKVKFGAGPLIAQFRGRPEVLTTFGEYRRLAAIPAAKVSGAWARSMGLALTQRWRERASYSGPQKKMTRRYLLTQLPPAPTVDEVLSGHDPARARRYFTQALGRLRAAGVIAAYREPDAKTLPRTGWANVWLGQTVDVTQPVRGSVFASGSR